MAAPAGQGKRTLPEETREYLCHEMIKLRRNFGIRSDRGGDEKHDRPEYEESALRSLARDGEQAVATVKRKAEEEKGAKARALKRQKIVNIKAKVDKMEAELAEEEARLVDRDGKYGGALNPGPLYSGQLGANC
ncbi:hypothetical protein LTR91_024943 [Friedmanniomyces endolithicus]|uniref:Uncharacterized protein n=2 Tax=Dothideomycetidae TaxID=451867 RepID=A0AAN6H166_9PEZI|nr:hypothetical protein LTS09_010264 [Friedmanniomyces endolithicus]KAK5140695.1 hypothetical protein LTR32_006569 [Rachicladosporium monterosium]KAK0366826.1 hypothetical protein LTR94_001585 [Friedmanniomyces endolithicus]KAK0810269.1 hypothetical protein LTR59_002262 [Friedmanniomyces endolithicus]KAK0812018.1 hypothetical protein LTR38_003453 [Friedmanniomyces endolithicus]